MTEPRILIFDIETAPNLAYVWGKWQQDVIRFESEWYILSVAWKWLGEPRIYVESLDQSDVYQIDPQCDYDLARRLHDLFDEADITVTHNGVSFDKPKAQSRMLLHGILPPSPTYDVDTLKVARREFAFNGNSLKDLANTLGVSAKGDSGGFDTWLGCLRGDEKAWARMRRYNKQDVRVTEELYEVLLPWISRHPNVAVLNEKPDACPKCGKGPLQSRGYRATNAQRRQRFQCQHCGGWCLARVIEKTPNKYVNL